MPNIYQYSNKLLSSDCYAVIDLGSNSFHLLITRLLADSVQVIDKVKRKVRLASGLSSSNELDQAAFDRGLQCLRFFSERLGDIPSENIRIVATATLRIATNADDFLSQAKAILQHDIVVLSGVEEAEKIYLGVAHTSEVGDKRLVLDIGGASTEMVVGTGFIHQLACSLSLGCVTLKQRCFPDGAINDAAIQAAFQFAKQQISPWVDKFLTYQWSSVLGGSGTMQAIAEILLATHRPAIIDKPLLNDLLQQVRQFSQFEHVEIEGLTVDRKPVFVSGLIILKSLFDCLNIEQLQLSSGAIREGVLYEMLPNMRSIPIKTRTVNSLIEKFHIDSIHSQKIKTMAVDFYQQLSEPSEKNIGLLAAASSLHEIGLLVSFKRHQHHAFYLLNNTDLPGFEQAERLLIATLIQQQKGEIQLAELRKLTATNVNETIAMLLSLRLSIILFLTRNDSPLPTITLAQLDKNWLVEIPSSWLQNNLLVSDELKQEQLYWQQVGFTLTLA